MLQTLINLLVIGLGGAALGTQAVVWYSFFFQTPRDINQTKTIITANHFSHLGVAIFTIAAMLELISHFPDVSWRHPVFGAAIVAEMLSTYFAVKIMQARRQLIDTAEKRLENVKHRLEVLRLRGI